VIDRELSELIAEMKAAEGEKDSLQFDGGKAWERLTAAMGEEVLALAKRIKESEDSLPTTLFDHLGTPSEGAVDH
jgi:hypothetical protein